MPQIKKSFNNISLHRKLLLIITISIFCIYLVFFLCFQYLVSNYEKTLYRTNAALLNHVSSSIESAMGAIETLSYNIITNSSIQNNLMDLHSSSNGSRMLVTRRTLYNTLNSSAFSSKYIKSISLLFPDQDYICIGNSSDLDAFDIDSVEKRLPTSKGKPLWVSERNPGGLAVCARQIRQIKYLSLESLSSLYLIIDLESMINDALEDAGYSPSDSNFILIADSQRIYPEKPYHDELCTELISDSSSMENDYKIIGLDDGKKFIIRGTIDGFGWEYLYFRDYNQIFYRIQAVKLMTFVFTILFGMIALFCIRISIRRILCHLDFLIQKIRNFGKGEQVPVNHYRYDDRTDEIGQLHQSFDHMTKSVKILRDENYDKQILLKDTTIKMLQQQINPHFLYNTLDTVNWLAQKYGVDDISTIVGSLGNLFRASISSQGELIPLTEELSFLDNYIRIQQIRFKDRMTFCLTVPENLSAISVPKLCIQPLVENALKYALEYSDDPCSISVTVQELEKEYLIEVSNTGSRFENDLLRKLQNHTIIPQGSGIGLINIDSRLKLLYGDNYGLNFYNHGEIATVTLLIPKEKEE